MHDLQAVFQKLDTRHKPARHRDALLASIEDAYCEERARERRGFWRFLIGVAIAYAAVVIGTTAAIKALLS